MKKLYTIATLPLLSFFAWVGTAQAQEQGQAPTGAMINKLNNVAQGLGINPVKPENAQVEAAGFAGGIIAALLAFTGVIFIVFIIYAGQMWMTAGGNTERVDKAKRIIRNCIIGIIITALAYALVVQIGAILETANIFQHT